MTGLLIKDLRLLKNQGRTYLFIILFAGVIAWFGPANTAQFLYVYIPILISMFTVSTFNYDEFDNGMLYLLSLPVRRRDYVTEKYLFGLLLAVASCLLSTVIGLLSGQRAEMLVVSGVAVILVLIMLCLYIVFTVWLGPEKGRAAGIFVLLGGFALFYAALTKFKDETGAFLKKVTDMSRTEVLMLAAALLAAAALFIIGCWLISVKLMERKEY